MKHGGNIYQFAELIGCLPEQVLDFSANINPEQAVDLSCLQQVPLGPYADPDYSLLKQAIRGRYGYPAHADIEVFNGASAAIFALLRSLQPQDLVLYTPLYGEYAHVDDAALLEQMVGHILDLQWLWSTVSDEKLAFLCLEYPGLYRYGMLMEGSMWIVVGNAII